MMNKRNCWHMLAVVFILSAFMVGFGAGPRSVQALDLGSVVKFLGIGYVVKQFGPDINGVINDLLSQHQAEIEGKTKVVPILRVGSGTAIGAAQVMGPAEQVAKVKAVAEVEWTPGIHLRARGLIPIASTGTTSIKGVGGVGVSANIKFPL